MDGYVERLCGEIRTARGRARAMGAELPEQVDTVYFGGGTPSLLESRHMKEIFAALRGEFAIEAGAEITLECAPGQLSEETLAELLGQGMNRVSLGVQSFVDAEAAGVGRLHTRAMCLAEIARLRADGVVDIGVDLIAGLPLQTEASWRYSVDEAIATGATHVSVYMLEVDGESRLGREALAGGSRYGAAALPSDEDVADWYLWGCERLNAGGVGQYEISNFAQEGFRSRHNLKYWRRAPYVGFGLDAHSMLQMGAGAVRFQNPDALDGYMDDGLLPMLNAMPEVIEREAAFEEAMFLGLRMNVGIGLDELRREFGAGLVDGAAGAFDELADAGLVGMANGRVWLTDRGRLLSNEVFERVLVAA
jgi:oxygen-independent coproporphyrinogen-3 oxidase